MAPPPAVDAPIVAVTVYPSQARVTRRGTATVAAGTADVAITGLPSSLLDDSVRVTGRGAARVVGVEVARRFVEAAPDAVVAELEERLRSLRQDDQALLDRDASAAAQTELLGALARRGGRSLADALAAGTADGTRVEAFGGTLVAQLDAVASTRRDVARQREELARRIAAAEGELELRRRQADVNRRDVVVSLEADADAAVELDVSYLVLSASWTPVYDARLADGKVTLTWHGLVTQRSGEDWPVTDLSLSTARPAAAAGIPELDPWYVDVWQPPPQPMPRQPAVRAAAAGGRFGMEAAAAPAAMLEVAEVAIEQATATAEQGVTAVTWRLPRPIAVPADGSPHKATITSLTLDAALDYLSVPKLAPEVYLRATVTNTSAHTLLPGRVSVFHDADFVGTTTLDAVAPGEEIELQLGVDDRVTVERELTRRQTSKTVLGNVRRTAVTYTITVDSHLPATAKVSVQDQFPVSRHERIKVDDTSASPEPSDRTDLGVVTWTFEVEPGASRELTLSFQLEHPRDLQVAGFSD
jgi:uncharacterized protein (TIGR02231 family)